MRVLIDVRQCARGLSAPARMNVPAVEVSRTALLVRRLVVRESTCWGGPLRRSRLIRG